MKKLGIINLLLLLGIIFYLVFSKLTNPQETLFVPEITAERLNIVGEDGNKYIVLSSPEKQALATINGKLIDSTTTERPVPGMIFFNQEGDEVGGLIFGIDSTNSYQLLTFDQRKNDQVMTLRKEEVLMNGTWKRRYGLLLQERSDKPITEVMSDLSKLESISDSTEREKAINEYFSLEENKAPQRLFIGRTFSGKVGLFLMDKNNQAKIAIYVDEEGNPVMEKVDSLGNRQEIQ